jgi:hypothetical protein
MMLIFLCFFRFLQKQALHLTTEVTMAAIPNRALGMMSASTMAPRPAKAKASPEEVQSRWTRIKDKLLWVWMAAAFAGNMAGVKLRPLFFDGEAGRKPVAKSC